LKRNPFYQSALVAKQAIYIELRFLTSVVRLLGILAAAKTQIPIKTNFMGKGRYVQK
jgi:hypothetical protein